MAWAPGHGVWAPALSLTGSSCPVSGPQFPHLSDEGVGPGHPRNLKQKSIPELVSGDSDLGWVPAWRPKCFQVSSLSGRHRPRPSCSVRFPSAPACRGCWRRPRVRRPVLAARRWLRVLADVALVSQRRRVTLLATCPSQFHGSRPRSKRAWRVVRGTVTHRKCGLSSVA